MSRKRTKVAAGLFTVVASLSFFTTSAFANFLGGEWDISTITYEDLNLESKYSDVLWTTADKWNGFSSIDLIPADSDETGAISLEHLSRDADNYLGWSGTYGYGIPYDDRGRENRSPYASAEIVIVRYLCDDLDEDDTINMMAHEFGHTLGLAHIDDSRIDSIMDYSDVFDWDVDGPTRHDKNNIIELYGK
ncbi:hypothetical protein FB479_101115 [Brevibacillus sp. AG162]|uniref:matrixin family metalloprotease n=1 Tax=Brevibacillus sp. AG162 TaxID=2572910 RepID=UPI00115074D4|nr:matrixin family metalloprotease [Brevibacillus sp. AG162]TQK74519.1 hypothetical protein FB479_101115 [Brevibacillus sp. AG162]